ncbi:MAG: hypothetical protein ACM3U1_11565 [Chloroflexota bacterium]
MKKFNLSSIYILALFIFAMGCAEENPDLVNPPPLFESVRMRFVNLSGDKEQRALRLDAFTSPLIKYGEASEPFTPGSDSSFYEILRSGSTAYKTQSRIRFSRNMTYTVVALPMDDGRDTIVAFTNSPAQIQERRMASLKLFNGVADSSARYSLRFGCPSGEPIGSELGFRGFGSMNLVESGSITFSIIKRQGGNVESIGTFSDSLAEFSQNVVIVYKGADGKEEVALLEETSAKDGYRKPEKISDLFYTVRTINLSSSPIELRKAGAGVISQGLAPLRIDGFQKVESCGSLAADTLQVFSNGVMTAKLTISPQAGTNYTAVVLDSGAKMKISLTPENKWGLDAGKASLQVVNASQKIGGISVSLGARTPEGLASGFITGEALAKNLQLAEFGEPTQLLPKYLPIAIFTATDPTRLAGNFIGTISAGERNLLVIYDAPDGSLKAAIVRSTDIDANITPLESGAFYQFVNAASNFVDLTLSPAFKLARVYGSISLASVLPLNGLTLEGTTDKAHAVSHSFTPSPDLRTLHILGGGEGDPKLLEFIYSPLVPPAFAYKRRFVNVSDIPNVGLRFNDKDSTLVATLAYGQMTAEELISKSGRVTFYFVNPADGKTLLTVSDNFIVGKGYTIIFAGSASRGYSIVSQQEF